MALFMQQSVASVQKRSKRQITLLKTTFVTGALISMLSLNACQTVPTPTTPSSTTVTQTSVITEDDYVDEDDTGGYPLEPYVIPKLPTAPNQITQQAPAVQPNTAIITPSHNDYQIPQPPLPSRNELLERARQNSQQQSHSTTSSDSSLPAFQKLMQSGMSQLKAGNLTAAEGSFTRAQRLAPQSPAAYFYLAQVALKKNQPRKAEAMARRGLSFSKDTSQRHALWQIILRSGQLQNNARVIKEAQQALR